MALWMAMSTRPCSDIGMGCVARLRIGHCHASQGTDVVARLLNAPEEVSMDLACHTRGLAPSWPSPEWRLLWLSSSWGRLPSEPWLSDAWRLAL